MSNPNLFMANYTSAMRTLVDTLHSLRGLNDMIVEDPTLIDRYFTVNSSGNNAQGQVPRNDITADDVENAKNATDQVIFAFDSGNPTQKSYIYKMLGD